MQGMDFVTGRKFLISLWMVWGCCHRLGLPTLLFFYNLCSICRDRQRARKNFEKVRESETAADFSVSKQEKGPLGERFLVLYANTV